MPVFSTPPRRGIKHSDALAEAYAHSTSDDTDLITIALYHSSFKDEEGNPVAIYCVNDFEDLEATIEPSASLHAGQQVTFRSMPFTFTAPEELDTGAPADVTLEIDSVSREVTPYLNAAIESDEPILVTIRLYMASDTSAPHEDPPMTLALKSPVVDVYKVSAKAGFGDLLSSSFPKFLYSRDSHPVLYA